MGFFDLIGLDTGAKSLYNDGMQPVYRLHNEQHIQIQIRWLTMNNLEHYLITQESFDEAGSSSLLREIAYERLKEAIKYADLQPGEVLSEVRLSNILGISRTPVREAIQQLAQEGLLEIIPGRAVIVPNLSIRELREVVHIRSLLEPELGRLAAQLATPEDVEALLVVCQEMQQAAEDDDRDAWSKADMKFHDTFINTCPNELLKKTVRQLYNRMHHVATSRRTTQARLLACTREHLAIAEAIAAGHAERAGQAVTEHIHQMQNALFEELGWPVNRDVASYQSAS